MSTLRDSVVSSKEKYLTIPKVQVIKYKILKTEDIPFYSSFVTRLDRIGHSPNAFSLFYRS